MTSNDTGLAGNIVNDHKEMVSRLSPFALEPDNPAPFNKIRSRGGEVIEISKILTRLVLRNRNCCCFIHGGFNQQ
jgi:hypothetical protein